MSLTLPVTIERSNRRTIAVQVMPDASVLVKAPVKISEKQIHQFLDENAAWIEGKIKHVQQHVRVMKHTYENGDMFYFLGSQYPLAIGNYKEIAVKDGKLQFPDFLTFRIKKELSDWYIREGKKIITERVEWYTQQMQASFVDLTFSDTKSQWGRCTQDNRLQFNWRLVMAPLLTINYVVVHELAHTFQKNHAASFWSKVRFYNPTYRQQRKWLETHGNSLTL